VRRCTAKTSFPCAARSMAKTKNTTNSQGDARQRISPRQSQQWRTAKILRTAKTNTCARQRRYDGKDNKRRTAKKYCTSKGLDVVVEPPLPCGQTRCTTKAPLPCGSFFAVRRHLFYLFFFYFISINTYIYFLN
jgi:hypothetical protein